MHYACVACIASDSVMRMEKNNYPQVYLEECDYRIKKIKMTKFIYTESESDSESVLQSDTELKSNKVRIWFWIVVISFTCNNAIYCLLLF